MSIVAKLKSVNDAATAAQLSEMIQATSAELSKANAEVARLESSHKAVLLCDDDKALDRHEQQTTAARRQVARLRALMEELEARHAAAVKREAEKALNAELARVEAKVERGRGLILRYAELAREIVAILNELEEIDREVERANRAAEEGKSTKRIASPGQGRIDGRGIHKLPLYWKDEVRLPHGAGEKSGTLWPEHKPHRPNVVATMALPVKLAPSPAPVISGSMVQSVGEGIV